MLSLSLLFRPNPSRAQLEHKFHVEAMLRELLQIARGWDWPRGLIWESIRGIDLPVLVEAEARSFLMLIAVEIQFRQHFKYPCDAIDESECEPRLATAIYRWDRHRWRCHDKVMFNLRPEELIARSFGRWKLADLADK